MASGVIPPSHYRSSDQFEREQQDLFGRTWVFACMAFELAPRSHKVVLIGKTEVILQRDDNAKPRAFLNSCSHRHSQLSPPGLHAGRIRCPYHGWTYDPNGIPIGMRQKAAFPAVADNPGTFALQEYRCESAGQFVFVCLGNSGPSLREYLGSQFGFLSRASTGMSVELDAFSSEIRANWKVVIENALEGYHVPNVHASTFMQVDGMDSSEAAPKFYFEDTLHSHLEHDADSVWLKRFQKLEKNIGAWPWRFECYRHHHVFPNLTVTSFMGYSFHIQVFTPTGPEATVVHSITAGVTFAGGNLVGEKLMGQIHADGHAFTRRVFAEDQAICEKVQRGLGQTDRMAMLGDGIEDRVRHFQLAYQHSIMPVDTQRGLAP